MTSVTAWAADPTSSEAEAWLRAVVPLLWKGQRRVERPPVAKASEDLVIIRDDRAPSHPTTDGALFQRGASLASRIVVSGEQI